MFFKSPTVKPGKAYCHITKMFRIDNRTNDILRVARAGYTNNQVPRLRKFRELKFKDRGITDIVSIGRQCGDIIIKADKLKIQTFTHILAEMRSCGRRSTVAKDKNIAFTLTYQLNNLSYLIPVNTIQRVGEVIEICVYHS